MERDTLDRFIAFVQKSYAGCFLWYEILEIIIADELTALNSRGNDEASMKLLRHEINGLDPNNPRRLAWDILDIHAGAEEKVEAKAKAKAEAEAETEAEAKAKAEAETEGAHMATDTPTHLLSQLLDRLSA